MTLVKVEMLHKVRITQGLIKKCVSSIWNVVLYGYYMDMRLSVKETFRIGKVFGIQRGKLSYGSWTVGLQTRFMMSIGIL